MSRKSNHTTREGDLRNRHYKGPGHESTLGDEEVPSSIVSSLNF